MVGQQLFRYCHMLEKEREFLVVSK